jgi:hypothetical protein
MLLVQVAMHLEHAAVTVQPGAKRPMQGRKALAADIHDRAVHLSDRADREFLWLHRALLETVLVIRAASRARLVRGAIFGLTWVKRRCLRARPPISGTGSGTASHIRR